MEKWIVAAIAAVLIIASCAGIYNAPASKEVAVEEAWGNVQSAYQRRYDLVPNLVETVKASSAFEERVFVEVTEARAAVGRVQITSADLENPQKMREFQEAQAALGSSLSRLLAVAENYPQLKSTQAYQDLMSQLEGTENRVNTERVHYNAAVKELNTCVVTLPCSLGAAMRGIEKRSMFEVEVGAEKAPKVSFGTGQ